MKKKLYVVTREVLAVSAEKAIREKGGVTSVNIAADQYQPSEPKQEVGFKIKK